MSPGVLAFLALFSQATALIDSSGQLDDSEQDLEIQDESADLTDGDPSALQITPEESRDLRQEIRPSRWVNFYRHYTGYDPQINHFVDIKTLPALVRLPGAKRGNLCDHGFFKGPELYLLGAAKCGTTSMAVDLSRAGIRSNTYPVKESHFFRRSLSLERPNMRREIMSLRQRFDNMGFGACPEERRIMAEMTPDNLRDFYLPHALYGTYSPSVRSNLKFVIMVREPLERIASGYLFWLRKNHSLPHAAEERLFRNYFALKLFTATRAVHNMTIQNPNKRINFRFHGSRYGAQLQRWRSFFEPDQFFIVPQNYYFGEFKSEFFHKMSDWLQVDLHPASFKETHVNPTKHKTAAQMLPRKYVRLFYRWIKPDANHFVRQMARDQPNGMLLAGYTSEPSNSTHSGFSSVEAWLKTGW